MNEYEYSKNVKSIKKYIDYCENNGFKLEEKVTQTRTLYRKNDGTMARITKSESNGIIRKELDFKEDKLTSEELTIRKESLPLMYTDDKAVLSILDFLCYTKDNTLERTRYTYVKENAKFELDEYVKPKKTFIVSLEGEKNIVDKIWLECNK